MQGLEVLLQWLSRDFRGSGSDQATSRLHRGAAYPVGNGQLPPPHVFDEHGSRLEDLQDMVSNLAHDASD